MFYFWYDIYVTGNGKRLSRGDVWKSYLGGTVQMASLSLRHIYKKYPGNVVAVKDVNLEIKDKEFIVLVGPSGCGKSTTLRMIAGLEGKFLRANCTSATVW